MYKASSSFIFALLFLCITVHGSGEKVPLYFSYITTKTGAFVSSGSIPVVDLALEQINNRTDILHNYSLNYTRILDSNVSYILNHEYTYTYIIAIVCLSLIHICMQCNHTASLDAFMQHFKDVSQPTYLSLLCCGCSTATIPVAEVSHYWNIPQVSFQV